MLVFLIDMADMFLMAYLIGILCEEISKKKIAGASVVLVVYASGILDSVCYSGGILLCEFLMLGLFMKGNMIQRLAWCMELQLLILIFDFLFKDITLIIEQAVKEDFSQYFNFSIRLVTRGVLILFLILFLWKKRSYIIKIFGEASAALSVYVIISMSVTIFILCIVYICLQGSGSIQRLLIPVFSAGLVIFSILLLILCAVVRILIYSKKDLKISNELEQEYMKQQKEYYEEIDEKNTELSSFRHDFNDYVYTMNDMAAREEIKELQEYLADLSQKRQTVYYIDAGNHVANAVINRYREMAVQQGIIFRYTGKWSGKLHGITDMEICSVLSNILKNALEAALYVPKERERKIVVEMGRETMYEYIFLENTAVGYEEVNGKLVTHKRDKKNHGIGMENVGKIMKKCGGTLEWEYKNGIFYTWVYFLAEEMTS